MMAAALTSVAYLSARPAAGGSPNPLTHSPGLWGEPYNLLAPGTEREGAPPSLRHMSPEFAPPNIGIALRVAARGDEEALH